MVKSVQQQLADLNSAGIQLTAATGLNTAATTVVCDLLVTLGFITKPELEELIDAESRRLASRIPAPGLRE